MGKKINQCRVKNFSKNQRFGTFYEGMWSKLKATVRGTSVNGNGLTGVDHHRSQGMPVFYIPPNKVLWKTDIPWLLKIC